MEAKQKNKNKNIVCKQTIDIHIEIICLCVSSLYIIYFIHSIVCFFLVFIYL
ncbi:uncharacterized protein BX663DRAFT_504399 [Cokeromyces recurvatus]|uniref:uncharacterized protein n=1 Tax=Cokeromyces recurvatus TaxID=90255 RepID=UPI002220C729|nr:uncharacterized protein BX663DRAFT_504399 [Cokeromyces recurvatus]KAI7904242.1 hypothetical protein BX663DRAFT_504399 [Cokeromyces recurvatus]